MRVASSAAAPEELSVSGVVDGDGIECFRGMPGCCGVSGVGEACFSNALTFLPDGALLFYGWCVWACHVEGCLAVCVLGWHGHRFAVLSSVYSFASSFVCLPSAVIYNLPPFLYILRNTCMHE